MTLPVGLHHVITICGDPHRNLDFYSGMLGLRLVKRTINFDDPGTYHLYYGDGSGTPGTILTFFAWPGARRGSLGVGQVTVTALRIPISSVSYWSTRLRENAVVGVELIERQGDHVIAFADPDGMRLGLVATGPEVDAGSDWQAWPASPVPEIHAIRGLHGVTATLAATGATTRLLTEILGLKFWYSGGHELADVDAQSVSHWLSGKGAPGPSSNPANNRMPSVPTSCRPNQPCS